MIRFDEQVWPCQPNGVTIEYYRGRPLGTLIGAVQSDNGLSTAFTLGESAQWTATESGVLVLKVNESPADLEDNRGTCQVTIRTVRD